MKGELFPTRKWGAGFSYGRNKVDRGVGAMARGHPLVSGHENKNINGHGIHGRTRKNKIKQIIKAISLVFQVLG
jgi:hypothetical protein